MSGQSSRPAIETRLRLPFEVDLRQTLAPVLLACGTQQMRIEPTGFVRATRTAAGATSVRVQLSGTHELTVEAWGDGAAMAVDALPDLLGARDDPAALVPQHRLVGELARSHGGLRLARSGAIFEALLPAIVGQKVTGVESRNSYRALVGRFGEQAPGPLGLRLPPRPEVLAAKPYWAFHELGLEERRADVIRHAAAGARSLEAADPWEARRRLLTIRGIGPWTAAETLRLALGDPDAISVGDYHLPNLVSWALAGEPRGSDERMLELLAPYEGQRARVALLLEMSGLRAPRYGPRLAPRSIAAM